MPHPIPPAVRAAARWTPGWIARLSDRLGLVARLVLGAMVVTLLALGGTLATVEQQIERDLRELATERAKVQTRLILMGLASHGPLRVEGDQLYAGPLLLNGHNELMLDVARASGDAAVVFLGDLRIATSVRGQDGRLVLGTRFDNAAVRQAVLTRGEPLTLTTMVGGVARIAHFEPLRDQAGQVVGMLAHGTSLANLARQLGQLRLTMAGIGLAALLGGAGLLWWLVRRSLGPVLGISHALRALAGGDTGAEVPGRSRRDKVGEMARAAIAAQGAVARTRALEAEAAAAQAAAIALQHRQREEVATGIERSLGAMAEALATASAALRGTTDRLAAETDAAAGTAQAVAGGAEQASGNVQAVAAAAEQMASSVAEITRRVAEAAEVANQAVAETRATDVAMRDLSEAATRIGDVVRMISDIAGQTNLLALNATIEAARAGDAGKGFAVVAGEVKTLAAQTGKATDEIGSQIAQMQQATQRALEAIRGIGTTVERTSGIATAIAGAVEEQGATTREIARSAAEAAGGTSEAAAGAARVTETARSSGQALRDLRAGPVEDVARHGVALRQELGAFLAKLRAAA